MSKIVDGFTFYNEFDTLKIRLATLWDVVDKFVLVESDHTFTGKPKPYYFAENQAEFQQWLPKIDLIHLVDPMNWTGDYAHAPWQREEWSRNAMAAGFEGDDPNDILIVSDVDEIPHPDEVGAYDFEGVMANLMSVYVYRINLFDSMGASSKAIRRNALLTPEHHRHIPPDVMTTKPGWHFSSLATAEQISDKFKAFSHTEIDVDEYTNPAKIQMRIDNHADPLDRGSLHKVEVDDSYPKYILENMEYFKKWMA